MKIRRTEYSLDEVPELEETEFDFTLSTGPRFEDANDLGHLGDSMSISMQSSNDFLSFDL